MEKLKNYLVMVLVCVICIEVTALYFKFKEYDLVMDTNISQELLTKKIEILTNEIASLQNEEKQVQEEVKKSTVKTSQLDQINDKLEKLLNSDERVYLSQGINRGQLRNIISGVMNYLGEKDSKWVDLLMITSQLESELGYLVKQVKGPAQGIFQVEPETEADIWKIFLSKNRNPNLAEKIKKLKFEANVNGIDQMQMNIAYNCAMAYCIYKWRKVDPSVMNIVEMLIIYKKAYNTPKGKAKILKSLERLKGTKLLKP